MGKITFTPRNLYKAIFCLNIILISCVQVVYFCELINTLIHASALVKDEHDINGNGSV